MRVAVPMRQKLSRTASTFRRVRRRVAEPFPHDLIVFFALAWLLLA